MGCYIGLDVGSVSADLVVVDTGSQVLEWRYVRTLGRPLQVSLEQLRELLERYEGVCGLCVTGNGAKIVAELLGVPFINEIVAQSRAAAHLHPHVRSIIEVGGQDSKLIYLAPQQDGSLRVVDFAMNSICAAGTGSFLEQQASRLRVSIEQFSRLALRSKHPPRVAGRCSVFAKSDMIHLQQQGTPDYDIIAGLCYAMARNFRSNLAKGKEVPRPVAFHGGVALNAGMVRAFRDVLGLRDGELVIPQEPGCTGALGAVLEARSRGLDCSLRGLEPLEEHIRRPAASAERLPRLQDDGYTVDLSCRTPPPGGLIDAYVGIDIGSISTNVVVIDRDNNVLARRYLMTEGRPIEAVKRGLYEVGQEVGHRVRVLGCCTTGSGRYLIGDFVGADVVKNEITTHARGAVAMDPGVDTIFEIGGQDAKYISLENGAVVDFAMNKVCAAGTGSFLEEQAERLGLRIEEEFGRTALASQRPVKLGERCTVFMESDLVFHQQRGVPTDDLVGGLCYSIVQNYLSKVVEDRKIGEKIFFQGGVAFNRGVKAAFERITGKQVTVPPHQDVLGAIGAAIIAREQSSGRSAFRGFDLRHVRYELTTFECNGCANRCEIHRVSIEGRKPLHYGSRCGRFDEEKRHKKGEGLPRPFAEREAALLNSYEKDEPDNPIGLTIGIPRTLTFFDLYPLWKAFFTELGCRVVLSEPTNRQIIARGAEHVTTETCFPIKVAHGHVADLLERQVDWIFTPSVINLEHEAPKLVHSYVCPLVQSLPYMLRCAFAEQDRAGRLPLLAPIFHFERGRRHVSRRLRRLARRLGAPSERIDRAIAAGWEALDRFRARCLRRGREILARLGEEQTAIVVVSRSYNGCDPGMNLAIPDKLRELGVIALPLDFLPLNIRSIQDEFPRMYWKYGQRILAAARYMARRPNLHAIYITNFRCGPDSFISKYFSRLLGKPYLTLEIDEHSADVGAITRCEAFLDSVRASRRQPPGPAPCPPESYLDVRERRGKFTVYIPHMDDHGVLLAAALRANGVNAEALPMSDRESMEIGRRFTTGKECFPCILTTGDIVKKTRCRDFRPECSGFFMAQATGPCRFGQYNRFHRMVLDELGLKQVPMVLLDQTYNFAEHMKAFGPNFYSFCWELLVIVDYMQKLLRQTRPYERNKGESDALYRRYLNELASAAERGADYRAKAAEFCERIARVPVDRSEPRPLVGIVGEIYVRSNEFANNFLVRRLEQCGAEVVLPPMQEWINYIAAARREIAWQQAQPWALTREWLTELGARWIERRVRRIFAGALRHSARERPIAQVLKFGSRYLHPTVKGEAVLSIGRAVEYAHDGFDGVVNVAPFGCMPGAVVNSLLERFRTDFALPVLKLEFDGLEQPGEATALEAFVHQAREHMESKRRARHGAPGPAPRTKSQRGEPHASGQLLEVRR